MSMIKICPICGSTDIRELFWGQWLGSGLRIQHECFDCHFTSKYFPEIEPYTVDEFRERIKK